MGLCARSVGPMVKGYCVGPCASGNVYTIVLKVYVHWLRGTVLGV